MCDSRRRVKLEFSGADTVPVHVMVLQKGDDRYVWQYSPAKYRDVLRSIGKFAADPELNLNWWDAANLAQQLKRHLESSQEEGNRHG